ncbi:MAG: PaaI family thioesterase [Anaerolineales bacterium]|nr:PaaI family thioesterase [Anaerolineales bacterium]
MKEKRSEQSGAPARIKQPNSRHCFVCGVENKSGLGLEFFEDGQGRVAAEPCLPESYQGYPGIVHGGIVAAMLDEVAGRAAMIDDHTHFRLTAKLAIRYRRPVPTGETIRLQGWVEEDRGRLVTAHAEVRLNDGTLAAEAEAVLADLSEAPEETEVLEALGWRVYADAEDEQGSGR